MSGGEAPLLRLICFDVLPSRVTACMTYLQLSDYRRTQQLHLALQVGFPAFNLYRGNTSCGPSHVPICNGLLKDTSAQMSIIQMPKLLFYRSKCSLKKKRLHLWEGTNLSVY